MVDVLKPYQAIAERKAEEVVNSLINRRRERYIEAKDYSFHPNRTFNTYDSNPNSSNSSY